MEFFTAGSTSASFPWLAIHRQLIGTSGFSKHFCLWNVGQKDRWVEIGEPRPSSIQFADVILTDPSHCCSHKYIYPRIYMTAIHLAVGIDLPESDFYSQAASPSITGSRTVCQFRPVTVRVWRRQWWTCHVHLILSRAIQSWPYLLILWDYSQNPDSRVTVAKRNIHLLVLGFLPFLPNRNYSKVYSFNRFRDLMPEKIISHWMILLWDEFPLTCRSNGVTKRHAPICADWRDPYILHNVGSIPPYV